MKKSFVFINCIFTFLFIGNPAFAQEIKSFDASYTVKPDGSMDVKEFIQYDFGSEQKHGIYRDIPVKYKNAKGNYDLGIDNIAVSNIKGEPVKYEIIRKGNGRRLQIGDPDKTVTGLNGYVIDYTISKQITFFNDHDELYWNVTGNNWTLPIRKASAIVTLPRQLEQDKISKDCFAGPQGSQKNCQKAEFAMDGALVKSIRFEADDLGEKEGLTFVVGFPKGILPQPQVQSVMIETIKDNLIFFLPFAVLIALVLIWRRFGRDPEGRVTIVPQYSPPDGLAPCEVGAIMDEKVDNYDISADLISLAVRGYVKIKRVEKKALLGKNVDYILLQLKPETDLANQFERDLLKKLFKHKGSVKDDELDPNDPKHIDAVKLSDLEESFYQDLKNLKGEVYASVVKKGYFAKNPQSVRNAYLAVGFIVGALSLFLGNIFGYMGVISLVASGVLIIIFSFFMPSKTIKGVLAKEYLLGLKNYLQVAEKDRLEFHNAPEKDPQLFEKLLPYAMALRVEKDWAKQFEDIYSQQPQWYSGDQANFSALALANSLDSFSAKANTTMVSRPPSASSGGSGLGGGGFSGGGFGGGGGGSW